MAKYNKDGEFTLGTIMVSPLSINLDTRNPRFIVAPDSSQESLRLYLLDNENIIDLANKMVSFGGLMPGERIIVTEENQSLVSLEGNRRICACQLFLNRDLIPATYKKTFPLITPEMRANIESIEVDFVPNRDSALRILATRHIEGPKRWEPVSKQKFFVELFESGKSLDEIEELTLTKKGKIKQNIQAYNLLQYALNLKVWTDEQKKYLLNIVRIEPTPFIRIFNIKNARKSFGLSFDPITLKPVSTLPKDHFDKAVELVATAAFITKSITTRTNTLELLLEHIPGLDKVIEIPGIKHGNRTPQFSTSYPKSSTQLSSQPQGIELAPQPEQHKLSLPSTLIVNNPDPQTPKSIPRPPAFFEGLSCTIDSTDPDASGVLVLAKEIRDISRPWHLNQFPIAASMLLRSLTEQSLKYHLKKINLFNLLIASKTVDPTLQQIITFINKDKARIFQEKTAERLYNTVFDNIGVKDSLDLVMHQTNLVRLNKQILESLATGGLRALIEYILNHKYA